MLGVLTAVVFAVGGVQATMVLPEQTRLAYAAQHEPLIEAPVASGEPSRLAQGATRSQVVYRTK
jgi:hypothetical protein